MFPNSFEESAIGMIPSGWQAGVFGDIAENHRRSVQPSVIEASSPYIGLEHMPRRSIAVSEWGTAEGLESEKFHFKLGEILFGKLRPYFHKVAIAPTDGVCSTDIAVVSPRDPTWFGFILGHISSSAFVEYTNAGSTGTKMPRTNWHYMARFLIALPPNEIAASFTALITPLVERIHLSIHEIRTLSMLRDALLPKLISGELRVPAADRIVSKET
jgi:type I restriction enzyme S subunit